MVGVKKEDVGGDFIKKQDTIICTRFPIGIELETTFFNAQK